MLDLLLPLQCGGCGAPRTPWCETCAAELTVREDQPWVITPRKDPGVPVLSLGRYVGARRQAIVAMKEHGRTDLIAPLAAAVTEALAHLVAWGLLTGPTTGPVTVVPAPTRRTSARRRGGDPVARIVTAATAPLKDLAVVPALTLRAFTRDSVGLSSAQRERNIAGRVRRRTPVPGPALLFDDIITTGATAAESVRVLQAGGTEVIAVLAVAHA